MREQDTTPRPLQVLLWATLAIYLGARICQLYADRLPTLLIVVLHVVPPAVFALVHGSILYRFRGTLVFTALCLGVAGYRRKSRPAYRLAVWLVLLY